MKHSGPANLVHMDAYGKSRNGVSPSEATRLLKKCRASVLDRLQGAVSAVMNQVDDTLFELADKAENNAIQTLYFDAMREVRIRRGALEAEFARNLVEKYSEAVKVTRRSGSGAGPVDDGEPELGLVDNDELEESLAVGGMVSKVRASCESELLAFDKRIGLLLSNPKLIPENNPLGPEVVCGAFGEACQEVDSGIEIRLILLKLFDKYAAALLPNLYQSLNRYLISNDVLPELREQRLSRPPTPRPQAQAPTQAPVQAQAPAQTQVAPPAAQERRAQPEAPGTQGDGLLAMLQQLLASKGGPQAMSPAPPVTVPVGTLQSLTRLQQGRVDAVPGVSGVLDEGLLTNGKINVLRQLKAAPIAQDGGLLDDITIDIVAMLFDFVLDARDIPGFMKALIGRLQIPILKVAMLDRSLFSKRTHPARRLLNALADAAIGWTEADQASNPVFKKAEDIVGRVLSDFEADLNLFSGLLEEFEVFRAKVDRAAENKARQSVKVKQGKEQLAHAKALSKAEVRSRTSRTGMPAVVRSFLTDHWVTLLTIVCLKKGEDSGEWQHALEVMERLIWSVEPKLSVDQRALMLQTLPALLKDLRQGMGMISMEANAKSLFMADLSTFHARAVSKSTNDAYQAHSPGTGKRAERSEPAGVPARGEAPERTAPYAAAGLKADRKSLTEELDKQLGEQNDQGARGQPFADVLSYRSDVDAAARQPVEKRKDIEDGLVRRREPDSQAQPESGSPEEDPMEVEEITIGDVGEGPSWEDAGDEYLDAARSLTLGIWVEFARDDGSRSKARLTWVSSATGVYLFTDWKGLKAAERTPAGLAAEFRRGSASIIERLNLFDWAVTNLIDGFKQGRAAGGTETA